MIEEILLEFAKKHSIDESAVNLFLAEKTRVESIEDLESLPDEMREHISFISFCPEPLQSFIKNEMWCERYMKIDLGRVTECVYDRMEYDDNGKPLSIEDSETNRKLKKVIDCLIDSKFGSVVYDW